MSVVKLNDEGQGPGLSENIPVCVPVDLVSLSQSDGVGNVA